MSLPLELLEAAEFFPAGHIVPRRVVSINPSKMQHRLRFNADCWVFSGPRGYLIVTEGAEECLHLENKGIKKVKASGSKYHPVGSGTTIVSAQTFRGDIVKLILRKLK